MHLSEHAHLGICFGLTSPGGLGLWLLSLLGFLEALFSCRLNNLGFILLCGLCGFDSRSGFSTFFYKGCLINMLSFVGHVLLVAMNQPLRWMCESDYRYYIIKWSYLCPHKILFTVQAVGQNWTPQATVCWP